MGSTGSIIMLVVFLGVFYALMILPQRRQQKKRSQMMNQLGPGAKILTAAGIYGTVVAINNDVLLINVGGDVEMEFDQRAVIRVVECAPSRAVESAE